MNKSKNSEIISQSLVLSQSLGKGRSTYVHALAAARNMISNTNSNTMPSLMKADGDKFVSYSTGNFDSKIPKLSDSVWNAVSMVNKNLMTFPFKNIREKIQNGCNLFEIYHEEMSSRYSLLPDVEGRIFEKGLEAFGAIFKAIFMMIECSNKKREKEENNETVATFLPKLPDIPKPIVNSTPNSKSKSKKEISRRENRLELENAHLEHQLNQLLSQLKDLEEEQALGYLQKEKEDLAASHSLLQKQFNDLQESYNSILSQNKISTINLKSSLQRTEKELKSLSSNYEKSQNKLKNLEIENEKYKENIIIYREVALMEHEELNSISYAFNENKQMMLRFKERAASLQARLDNLLNSNPDQMEIPSELSTDKDVFLPLRQSLLESPIFVKKITRKEEISNFSSKDETAKLMVSRPSFALLIENKMKSYMNQQPENPNKVSLLFLATLRAILDSKMNEILLHRNNPKNFSKFVDFTYSWLGMFEVHAKTRKVQQVEHSSNSDDIRAMFLVDLSNPRLDRLWECVNFKEFFKEEFPDDELYFYLYCRHLLFKGSQLNKLNASFDLIHYVTIEVAEEFLKVILERYDRAQILFATSKLKEKSKRKGINVFVDSAFVLRILLEYYKSEKTIRLGMIRDLFYTQPTIEVQGKPCIQFHSFKKILDANFPTITDIEKSELYRESFALGNGSINADSFYTAGIETGFFIKVLKIPTFHKLPIELSTDKSKVIPESSIGLAATVLLENLKDKHNIMSYSVLKMGELGIESLCKEWKELHRMYSGMFQISKLDFKFEGLFDYLCRMNEIWVKTANIIMIHAVARGDIEDVKIVQIFSKQWDSHFEIFKLNSDEEALILIEQHGKAKKLQAFIKKRISKWYMLMNQLFTSKLKKTLGNKLKT